MARLPRYFAAGVPQHVILRGNNRQAIFAGDEDCRFFKETLLEAAQRFGLAIHAYVFMTNHIHLLASPETADSLPKTLQSLGRRYVQYFNYRQQRTGTLWEGRYRATVVEEERYLFECMRYIELNPVRAGMVAHPGEFAWSSYQANSHGSFDALVTPHLLYLQLGSNEAERQAAYQNIVKEPLDAEQLKVLRECTHKGWALGGGQFHTKIQQATQRRATPQAKGRPKLSGVRLD